MFWMIGADVQRQRQRSAFVRQLFDLGLLSASPIQCIFSPTVAAYLLCISWLSACEIPQTSPKHQTPVVTVNVLHAWWHSSHQWRMQDNAIQIQNIAKTQKTPVVINVFHTWLAQFLSMRAKKSGAYKICELGEMILLIDIHPHSWFCAGAGL